MEKILGKFCKCEMGKIGLKGNLFISYLKHILLDIDQTSLQKMSCLWNIKDILNIVVCQEPENTSTNKKYAQSIQSSQSIQKYIIINKFMSMNVEEHKS